MYYNTGNKARAPDRNVASVSHCSTYGTADTLGVEHSSGSNSSPSIVSQRQVEESEPLVQRQVSSHSMGNRREVLPDGIDPDDWLPPRLNPCTKEQESDEPPIFDYIKFMEFHRLRALLFEVEWNVRNASRAGNQASSKSRLDGNWDGGDSEYYKSIFEDMFGPVDFQNGRMDKQLETMRATMRQCAVDPKSDEELLEQLVDEGIVVPALRLGIEPLKEKISSEFTLQEQMQYTNLDPSKAEGDWFNIPRPELSSIREEHFDDFAYEISNDDVPKGNLPMRGYKGLSPTESSAHHVVQNNEEKKEDESSSSSDTDSSGAQYLQEFIRTKHNQWLNNLLEGVNEAVRKPRQPRSPLAPVNLPKPSLKSLSSVSSDLESRLVYKANVLKNLHVYDPKFELCFNQPYRVFSNNFWGSNSQIVPRRLSSRILETLNNFPNGVTSSVFWNAFSEINGYTPRVVGFTRAQLLENLTDEIYVPSTSEPMPKLMLPNFLCGITNPELVRGRVWHAIMCMLGETPAIKTDEIFPKIAEDYSFSFNPLDWGYKSVKDFLEECLIFYDLQDVLSVNLFTFPEDHLERTVEYLMVNKQANVERIQALHANNTMTVEYRLGPIVPRIPDMYMGHGDIIEHVSNYIGVGETHSMELMYLKDPHRMFFVPWVHHPKLRVFQYSMQQWPMSTLIAKSFPVHPASLTPGLYVMAEVVRAEHPLQWYRCRVIAFDESRQNVFVYGIDWGFLKSVPLKNLRLMPKQQITEEPAYAIPVRLHVSHPFKKAVWEFVESCNTMWDLIPPDSMLRTEFLFGEENPTLGCMRWLVSCSVIFDKKVIHESLTISFYEAFKKCLEGKMKNKKETPPKPATSEEEPSKPVPGESAPTAPLVQAEVPEETPAEKPLESATEKSAPAAPLVQDEVPEVSEFDGVNFRDYVENSVVTYEDVVRKEEAPEGDTSTSSMEVHCGDDSQLLESLDSSGSK